MIEGQFTAVAAVRSARPAIERAARAMEARLKQGGRLIYAGAGTSGRLAVQDGAELIPTFNWPQDRLLLLMAGGKDALLRSVEGAEDEAEQAARLMWQHHVSVGDVLIAVAASGTTPFTLGCLREAKKQARADHRHRQQSRHAVVGRSRPSDLAGYRAGADRRLDPDEGRHGATHRHEPALVAGDDPARPRL